MSVRFSLMTKFGHDDAGFLCARSLTKPLLIHISERASVSSMVNGKGSKFKSRYMNRYLFPVFHGGFER